METEEDQVSELMPDESSREHREIVDGQDYPESMLPRRSGSLTRSDSLTESDVDPSRRENPLP